MDEPAPKNEPGSFLSIISDVSKTPNMDPEILHRLIDANERVMQKQAEIDFNDAFIKMKPLLPVIVKDAPNQQTNSKYAKLENIKENVDTILFDHGFYYTFDEIYPDNDHIVTVCKLTHKGGHSITAQKRLAHDDAGIKGTTNKTQVHAAASTGTYGQRLSLAMALSLTFVGFDKDGNAPDEALIDDAQFQAIQALIEETETDTAAFCKHLKVESLKAITNKQYPKAVQDLKGKLEKQKVKKDG